MPASRNFQDGRLGTMSWLTTSILTRREEMNPEIILQATVEGKDLEVNPFDRTCDHYVSWVQEKLGLTLTQQDIEADGTRDAFHKNSEAKVQLKWNRRDSAGIRAIRIETTQQDDDGEYQITTSVGIVEDKLTTTLRVVVGYDFANGVLAPTYRARIVAPGFLRKLFADDCLIAKVFGDQINNGVTTIESAEQLTSLIDDLINMHGLPALVLSGDSNRDAERIARNLQGELRVFVCRSPEAFGRLIKGQRALHSYECGILLWQSAEKKPLYLKSVGLETFVRNEVRKVTARALNRDHRWIEANLAVDAEDREKDLEERAERERLISTEKDSKRKIELLLVAQEQAKKEIAELEKKIADKIADHDRRILKQEREFLEIIELEGNYKELLEKQQEEIRRKNPDAASAFQFNFPPLAVNAQQFFTALMEQSDQAIAFTNNALKKWELALRRDFNPIHEMEDALISLMKAAVSYRAQDGGIGDRLGEWLTDNFGLSYAPFDDTIKIEDRTFKFEEKTYSRTKHIKVTDSRSFNDVGRIYFCDDFDQKRLIVDVVGQKIS